MRNNKEGSSCDCRRPGFLLILNGLLTPIKTNYQFKQTEHLMWWKIKGRVLCMAKAPLTLKNNLLNKHQKYLNCQNILELKGMQFDPVSDPKQT